MKSSLLIGTRSSPLALWQAEFVRTLLCQHFPHLHIELRHIKTTGDRILDSPLSKIGDKGLFTRDIELALLSGDIDLAVHSLKDLPTETPDGLIIAAVTAREATHDVLISNAGYTLATLPHGARIATSSLRRRSQLLALRPDLQILDMRGNLNTRLRKFDERSQLPRHHPDHLDAMVLAFAGVHRLGLDERISEHLSHEQVLPAAGQGALAIEVRCHDAETLALVEPLNDMPTLLCTAAERSLLRYLQGGCQIPIGALATLHGETLTLSAFIGALSGQPFVRRQLSQSGFTEPLTAHLARAEALGIRLADELLQQGGRDILAAIRNRASSSTRTV